MEVSYSEVKARNGLSARQRGGPGINFVRNGGDIVRAVLLCNVDESRYEDEIAETIIRYDLEDQVFCRSGKLRKNPKPVSEYGLVGRNRSALNAIRKSKNRLPVTILDRNPTTGMWFERSTTAFATDVVLDNGRAYFTVHLLFVPRNVISTPYYAGDNTLLVSKPRSLRELGTLFVHLGKLYFNPYKLVRL